MYRLLRTITELLLTRLAAAASTSVSGDLSP